MCNCSSSLSLTLFFNKWSGSLQMVGWGNGTVIGIGVLASSSAAVNILNTGILGTYGSMDMHYTGMVRMWDMPYRLTSVPSSMNVFFEATSGMKVFVEQEFIYEVHLGGAKFWGDFMVFLSAVVHLQISLLCSKGCKLWLMAFSYVLMPMVVPQAKWVSNVSTLLFIHCVIYWLWVDFEGFVHQSWNTNLCQNKFPFCSINLSGCCLSY